MADLLSENNTQEDGIQILINTLRIGTPIQKHDAAKALGYIAKAGLLKQVYRHDLVKIIVDILTNESPGLTVAFALLEALIRIDEDAFWSLIISFYSKSVQSASSVVKMQSIIQNTSS